MPKMLLVFAMAPRAFGVSRPSPRGRKVYSKKNCPTDRVPHGAVPEGDVQDGGLPPGPDPPGGVPDGGVPEGEVPFISIPAGGVPEGRVPFICMPAGGVPEGAVRLPGSTATVTVAWTGDAAVVCCTITGETAALPVSAGVLPVDSCVHPAAASATARMIPMAMMKMLSGLMSVPLSPS